SQQVSLSCSLDHSLTSSDLNLIWLGPKRNELLYVNTGYHHPEARLNAMWGLSVYRIVVQNTTWFTCNWNGLSGNRHMLPNRTKHQEKLPHSRMDPEYFSCDAPVYRNWTEGTLLWIQHDSPDQNIVLINMTIRRSVHYSLDMNASLISLILPRVTLEDAGNYSCQWKNQTCYFQLEVIAKTGAALSKLAPARRYFYAKRNKRSISNRIMVSAGNDDEQVDAYENMPPDMGAQRGQRLLQKGKILPNTFKMEGSATSQDEEEYECPDSETELKSGDVLSSIIDVLIYENNKDKVKFDLHNGNSADSWYSNKTEMILENLTQDQDPIDNENYINLEEECPMNSGTARLIAGLRLQLALDIHKDRQDGDSEPSTGSQSYEEMNGSLCPTASKLFYLHTNTSNEEDADSYENMESPTSLNSRRDGILDPHGEGKLREEGKAALTVTVPEGPIQAKPGSDVLLPCYFEESSGHIDPKRL
ncbi:B-lymphocyte antigen CD19, partial [Ophiophagus hannah]